jgi:hypothetical protein
LTTAPRERLVDRHLGPALGGDRPSERADVGARVVRKQSTDRRIIVAVRRAGIEAARKPAIAAAHSRRYAAPARMLSRTTD